MENFRQIPSRMGFLVKPTTAPSPEFSDFHPPSTCIFENRKEPRKKKIHPPISGHHVHPFENPNPPNSCQLRTCTSRLKRAGPIRRKKSHSLPPLGHDAAADNDRRLSREVLDVAHDLGAVRLAGLLEALQAALGRVPHQRRLHAVQLVGHAAQVADVPCLETEAAPALRDERHVRLEVVVHVELGAGGVEDRDGGLGGRHFV